MNCSQVSLFNLQFALVNYGNENNEIIVNSENYSLRSALCKPYTGVDVHWIGKTHLQESDKFFIILFFLCSDSQPVNFKHLLSMGYQRDWFDEQGQKAKQERAEQKVFIKHILHYFGIKSGKKM